MGVDEPDATTSLMCGHQCDGLNAQAVDPACSGLRMQIHFVQNIDWTGDLFLGQSARRKMIGTPLYLVLEEGLGNGRYDGDGRE